MATYEKPLAMATTGVAEGVFAASGAEETCWTARVSNDGTHNIRDGVRWIEFSASHANVSHVGETVYCEVTLNAGGATITDVGGFNGYYTTWDGLTAKVTGTCVMNPNEKWEFKLGVTGENLEAVTVSNIKIWDE